MSEEVEVDSLSFNSGPEIDRVDLSTIHLRPAEGNITCAILDMIEAELETYEKISLVFLLYDNAHLSLQYLLKESRKAQTSRSEYWSQSNLFSEWARSGRLVDWEDRFLEALCIIQNFYVVERLGYNKDDLVQRFLPENADTSMNVDHTRKRLYMFCEKLSSAKENDLIDRIERTIGRYRTPIFFQGDFKCMEMFLLYLISERHILHHNGVTAITKHLKAMGEISLCEFLEPLSSRQEISQNFCSSNQVSDDDLSLQGNSRAPSIVSTTGLSEHDIMRSDNEFYKIIDPNNIGVCVIINQKRFYCDPTIKNPPHPPLGSRTGTDEDRDCLIETFGHFGFTVHVWEDLTHDNLINAIETATKTMIKAYHSCFVLCILSHGQKGTVYGVNSIPVEIEEIHRKMQGKECPQLINKLKILIIQACQGEEQQEAVSPLQLDEDVASDGLEKAVEKAPEISDSMLIASTIPGYVSFRDRLKGSWFIQSLCKHLLCSNEGVDIRDVCLKINGEVRNFLTPDGKKMQPEYRSTLQAKPYLPCKKSARKKVVLLMIKRFVFFELLKEYLKDEYMKRNFLLDNLSR